MELKNKLKEKITEIDEKVGEKLINLLKMHNGETLPTTNGYNDGNDVLIFDDAASSASSTTSTTASAAQEQVMTAAEPVNVASTEDLVSNRLSALVECETPVDDDDDDCGEDNNVGEEKNADDDDQQSEQAVKEQAVLVAQEVGNADSKQLNGKIKT